MIVNATAGKMVGVWCVVPTATVPVPDIYHAYWMMARGVSSNMETGG